MKISLFLIVLFGLTYSARINSENRRLTSFNNTNNTLTNLSQVNFTSEDESSFSITNYFPELFFTNKKGKPGHNFLAFKTKNGQYLGCDISGNITVYDKEISKQNLFIVVFNNLTGRFGLRSWFGGYLSHENSFTCIERKVSNKTDFMVEIDENVKKLNLDIKNYNETIAIKFIKGYFGVENNNTLLIPTLNANAIFYAPFKTEDLKDINKKDYYFEIARAR
jgi:hypothetical protein